MAQKDEFDFTSLFNETANPEPEKADELFEFDMGEAPPQEVRPAPPVSKTPAPPVIKKPEPAAADPGQRKRSSDDFQPDMDTLLLTAQSSMIIEGTKNLTLKNYSSKVMGVYTEALNGINLYIKILVRNPNNYKKLSMIINQDMDCREVEKIAFNLYKAKMRELPETDDQKLRAYELFRDKLKEGYDKTMISQSIGSLKQYYLLSGTLNEDLVNNRIAAQDQDFLAEMSKLNDLIQVAGDLLKSGRGEIAQGMKGKDVNIFIIKSTELLSYYYQSTGNRQAAEYYSRLNNNYKKYFIIR